MSCHDISSLLAVYFPTSTGSASAERRSACRRRAPRFGSPWIAGGLCPWSWTPVATEIPASGGLRCARFLLSISAPSLNPVGTLLVSRDVRVRAADAGSIRLPPLQVAGWVSHLCPKNATARATTQESKPAVGSRDDLASPTAQSHRAAHPAPTAWWHRSPTLAQRSATYLNLAVDTAFRLKSCRCTWRLRRLRRSSRNVGVAWERLSPVSGSTWRSPNNYRKAAVRWGTATSTSTRPGTTSSALSRRRDELRPCTDGGLSGASCCS